MRRCCWCWWWRRASERSIDLQPKVKWSFSGSHNRKCSQIAEQIVEICTKRQLFSRHSLITVVTQRSPVESAHTTGRFITRMVLFNRWHPQSMPLLFRLILIIIALTFTKLHTRFKDKSSRWIQPNGNWTTTIKNGRVIIIIIITWVVGATAKTQN